MQEMRDLRDGACVLLREAVEEGLERVGGEADVHPDDDDGDSKGKVIVIPAEGIGERRTDAPCPHDPHHGRGPQVGIKLVDGQTDLAECLRAYRDVGYEGVCRPDHYPKMGDANFDNSHHVAQLFAVGYLKGLREAVYSEC